MALRIKVKIDKREIARLHSEPFGEVHKNLHKEIAEGCLRRARMDAPVGNPLDALHRTKWGVGSPPGTYKASFGVRYARGSNQNTSRMIFYNSADHAIFVEKGRSGSSKYQAFAWSKAPFIKMKNGQRPFKRPGWKWWLITAGGKNSLLDRTGPRAGKRVMGYAMMDSLRPFGIPYAPF